MPDSDSSDPLAGLPPRRRAFVQAYADPASPTFGNGTQAAKAAGYSPRAADVEASRLLGNARVQEATEAILARHISRDELVRGMADYFRDADPKVRPSAVRAGELLMRGYRMTGPDTEVSVDARSLVLPSLDASVLAALEATLEPDNESRTT